jgi:hypothetical protein
MKRLIKSLQIPFILFALFLLYIFIATMWDYSETGKPLSPEQHKKMVEYTKEANKIKKLKISE